MHQALALLLGLFALQPGEVSAREGGASLAEQGPPSADQDSRININEAGVDELVRLPGIGPTRAQAIIAEREKQRFRRIEDILRVPGIGRKTFDQIRHAIRVQ